MLEPVQIANETSIEALAGMQPTVQLEQKIARRLRVVGCENCTLTSRPLYWDPLWTRKF